jgi:bifunctional oligoribonuclease and PAP phosphatase NrnA
MKTTMTIQWSEAIRAVGDAARIVIVTHVQPDGDAIGTTLGLSSALRAAGKRVDVAVDGGVPSYLKFLPGVDTFLPTLAEGEWDVFISADASDAERTGTCGAYARAHSTIEINLDHHITNTGFGDICLIIPDAVSAAEVAYDFLTRAEYEINRESAKALLTGMVTDTIGFRTANVVPRTLDIARDLMQRGASLTEITALTLDTRSFGSLLVWREALGGLQLEDGVIWVAVPFSVFRELRVDPATELNLSGFLIKVDEARISAVFKERHDGRIECSFRAKLGYAIGDVALVLGGGGHTLASGATIDGPIDAAVARVIPMLKEAVRKGRLIVR